MRGDIRVWSSDSLCTHAVDRRCMVFLCVRAGEALECLDVVQPDHRLVRPHQEELASRMELEGAYTGHTWKQIVSFVCKELPSTLVRLSTSTI